MSDFEDCNWPIPNHIYEIDWLSLDEKTAFENFKSECAFDEYMVAIDIRAKKLKADLFAMPGAVPENYVEELEALCGFVNSQKTIPDSENYMPLFDILIDTIVNDTYTVTDKQLSLNLATKLQLAHKVLEDMPAAANIRPLMIAIDLVAGGDVPLADMDREEVLLQNLILNPEEAVNQAFEINQHEVAAALKPLVEYAVSNFIVVGEHDNKQNLISHITTTEAQIGLAAAMLKLYQATGRTNSKIEDMLRFRSSSGMMASSVFGEMLFPELSAPINELKQSIREIATDVALALLHEDDKA